MTHSGRAPWIAALALLATIVAVFGPALRFDATSVDDDAVVFRNPIQRDFGRRELRDALDPRASRLAYGLQYTPIADLSYALDGRLLGRAPGAYHLQGLLLHVAATSLLVVLARRLGASATAAASAGALFGLHPLQVEPVVSISAREVVWAGALLLAMLVAWQRARAAHSRGAAAGALALAVLANLAKQTAVVSALLVIALDLTVAARNEPWRRRLRVWLPHLAITVAFVWLGLVVGRREGIVAPSTLGAAARLRLALAAVGLYARMLVWPVGLLPAYDVDAPAAWLDGRVVAGTAAIVVGLVLIAAGWRRAPRLVLGVLLAGIALAPVAHGLGTQVVADRYAYVAMAGIALAVASVFELAAARAPRAAGTCALVGIAACTLVARARVDVWRNDVTLFADAAATEPGKPLWHHLLGRALIMSGAAETGRAEMALARRLAPNGVVDGYCPMPAVVGELARQRERAGDLDAAEAMLRTALVEARPGETDAAAVDLAGFYLRRGDRARARDAYLDAVTRDPDDAPRATEALRQLDREAALHPGP